MRCAGCISQDRLTATVTPVSRPSLARHQSRSPEICLFTRTRDCPSASKRHDRDSSIGKLESQTLLESETAGAKCRDLDSGTASSTRRFVRFQDADLPLLRGGEARGGWTERFPFPTEKTTYESSGYYPLSSSTSLISVSSDMH